MSFIADELRPFWLPGINRVTGIPNQTLVGLLGGQAYQVYTPLTATTVELSFSDWAPVANAFANDSARSAMAAVESIDSAPMRASLPLATGWLLIKSYYAGFFAAHALQRMLGRSIVQVDGTVASAIDSVAGVYGMATAGALQRGLFRVRTNATSKTISLSKVTTEGSHESLWTDTVALVRELIQGILTASASATSAIVAGKLAELEQALTESGLNVRGSWLSVIRNRVNYQQSYGVWYPYREQPGYCQEFAAKLVLWQRDPSSISFWPAPDRDLQRFLEACVFLVALCRAVVLDMNSRCPEGRSFHYYTTVRLLQQLRAA